RRHTRSYRDWSSDVCSSDLLLLWRRRRAAGAKAEGAHRPAEASQRAPSQNAASGYSVHQSSSSSLPLAACLALAWVAAGEPPLVDRESSCRERGGGVGGVGA